MPSLDIITLFAPIFKYESSKNNTNIIHRTYKEMAGRNSVGRNSTDIHILNVRLPEEIVEWIDSLVDAGIYGSRSEVVREFIREYLRSNRNG